MKVLFTIITSLLISAGNYAQQLTNIVFVSDSGITKKVEEAKFFIAIKSFPDGRFERMNYVLYGPLQSLQTYRDSSLSVLEGVNLVYGASGLLTTQGYYINNKKDSTWYYFNDTFKIIRRERYKEGVLVEREIPDSIKEQRYSMKYLDERAATYKGGEKAWKKYLTSRLDANVAANSVAGGEVNVFFRIDKNGDAQDIYLRKSVEFVLDEEALRVLYKMPRWQPSFQNGKYVNAYRVQPLTFVKSQ